MADESKTEIIRILGYLTFIALVTVVGVFIFEQINVTYFHPMRFMNVHIYTIIMVGVLTPLATLIVISWLENLNKSIIKENKECKGAEIKLRDAKAQAELYLDLMSHDIRNMNQVGPGFLEVALTSSDIKKEDRALLLKSLGSMENSTRLIDNVRKMQKAMLGELKLYTVDARQTFMRVLDNFSNVSGIKASFNFNLLQPCLVKANDLLYDVFENLVGNAIKHGGPEPVIDIRVDIVVSKGIKYNRFIVEDNGPGIPDAMKERVFNRLQREDTKAKGIGLGLYLVKSLVESFHGRVWVEDHVPGDHTKGARFVVMLPAVEK